MPSKPSLKRVASESVYAVPTIIEFLLDETGSMNQARTIAGFNEFLHRQQADQSGPCLLTFTKFDSYRSQRTPYMDLDITLVPKLTAATFFPNGTTNLHDSLISRIDHLKNRLTQWDVVPRVLLVTMTDGLDNASHHTVHQTAERVRHASEHDGWTMVYLGADQNAEAIGATLGFHPLNIQSFASAEIENTMASLSIATSAFRAAAVSSNAFFADKKGV